MERKISAVFREWLDSGKDEVLLVKGARQVGKTYSITEFLSENFESFAVIDFYRNREYLAIFDGELSSDAIIRKIELTVKGFKLIPGKTALLLDEIQFCPNARTALKYLAQDRRFRVIASGSLLGLNYSDVKSYPVGYERTVIMYPMDFEEFLWAAGVSKETVSFIRSQIHEKKSLEKAVRNSLDSFFLTFVVVGGMPEAVSEYLDTKNMDSVRIVQKKIMEGYRNDIGKYSSGSDRNSIFSTIDSIPFQLSQENKKFMYSRIEADATPSSNNYSSGIQWLVDAGIVIKCYSVTNPKLPLLNYVDSSKFKLYFNDTGLLISMLPEDVVHAITAGDKRVNRGAIIENAVACCFRNCGHIPYYFSSKNYEIDFITSMRGNVVAAEVKSGNNKKSKSLLSVKDKYDVKIRMKFEMTDSYVDVRGIEHYPLFVSAFIDELYDSYDMSIDIPDTAEFNDMISRLHEK